MRWSLDTYAEKDKKIKIVVKIWRKQWNVNSSAIISQFSASVDVGVSRTGFSETSCFQPVLQGNSILHCTMDLIGITLWIRKEFFLLNWTSSRNLSCSLGNESCVHILCACICPISGSDNFAPIFNHFGSSSEVSNFFKVGQLSREETTWSKGLSHRSMPSRYRLTNSTSCSHFSWLWEGWIQTTVIMDAEKL